MDCSKAWRWLTPDSDPVSVQQLALELGLHRLTAASLLQRGVTTAEEARQFFTCDLGQLADPFSMVGVRQAAERLALAVRQQERVLICGDYDVDGVTSVALFVRVLQKLGIEAAYYIPSRLHEGYGLQGLALTKFAAQGITLAVTVDCGINSFAEMELARSLGLDLIITDHHECFPGQRCAVAVVNPKQPECAYAERNLAGVGVAWTVVRALHSLLAVPFAETASYLDWVALGTIADVVPLLGENRILVYHGLKRWREQPSPGLAALAQLSGLTAANVSAEQVAFMVAPRLNAPGRLGDAAPAVQSLLAEPAEAEALALELDEKNRQRQQVEKGILAEARTMAGERPDDAALVLWSTQWHAGVVGIVAGRLSKEFARPVALIALADGEGRGSIRTVPGCNVVAALHGCAEHLVRFGGHPEAAGLTVEVAKLEAFRAAFCAEVANQEQQEYTMAVTAEAQLSELSLALFTELSQLEPFGHGNPEPLFYLRNADVITARRVGVGQKHLQLRLQKDNIALAAIHFGGGEEAICKGVSVDVVTSLASNTWQGRTTLSLHVRGLRKYPEELGIQIFDARGITDNDAMLARLATEAALVIWVNTKAAKDSLTARFAGLPVTVTQLGREVQSLTCHALILYHLPFERKALEILLASLTFSGAKRVYLCYGQEEYILNERVFAASIPSETTLQQIAACREETDEPLTPQGAKERLCITVTKHLLSRAEAVFRELGCVKGQWRARLVKLHESTTYREDKESLMAFRAYQQFWQEASTAELAHYINQPMAMSLPEGDTKHEPGKTQRTS